MVHAEVQPGTTPVCSLQLCAAGRLAEAASVAAAAIELEAVDSLEEVAHTVAEVAGTAAADAALASLVDQELVVAVAFVDMVVEGRYAEASEHTLAAADLPGPEAKTGMGQRLVMVVADKSAAAVAAVGDVVEAMVAVDTDFAVPGADNHTDWAALPSGCHMSRIAEGFAEVLDVVVVRMVLSERY